MSNLHYTAQGNGPPLVFVHGLAGSSRWWRANTRLLSKHFTVYLVDLPGFGRSRATGRGPLAELVASLPGWLDRHGLERVHLVGHSMGGYIASHLAATRPERVGRLALIDSVGIPLNLNVAQMLRRVLQGLPHSAPLFVPIVVADGLRAGLPYLLRLTNEIVQVDTRVLLPQIEAPTLLLWGTRDTVVPPALGLEMSELIPDSRFYFIPRAGHNAMADRPELVNRYLVDFFLQALPSEQPIDVDG